MRTFLILRALVVTAALTAPLTQAALAQSAQQQQQALANGNMAAPSYGAGPYSDQATAPPVGD